MTIGTFEGLPLFVADPDAGAGVRYIAKGWACETADEDPTGCGHTDRRTAGRCRNGTWMRYTEILLDQNRQIVGAETQKNVMKHGGGAL